LERPSAEPQHEIGRRGASGIADEEAQRPAGEEDEEIGRIRDREIPVRQMLVEDARNMVDEDRDERKAAPEIDCVGLAWHRITRAPARTLRLTHDWADSDASTDIPLPRPHLTSPRKRGPTLPAT